jgi:hypothetical protein
MAKLTMVFGVVLIGLGLLAYHAGGHGHSAMLGGALLVCGLLANTENPKQRMIWMHIAVTLGLIGFLFPGITGLMDLHKAGKNVTEVHLRLVTSVVCLVYTALCVRSFIAARRARLA